MAYKIPHGYIPGNEAVFLPQLNVKIDSTFEAIPGTTDYSIKKDIIKVSWGHTSEAFTLFNPQIWMFRYRRRRHRKNTSDLTNVEIKGRMNKGFVHYANNTDDYNGSKFFGGNNAKGIQTEWDLPPIFEYFDIPIDYKKFYRADIGLPLVVAEPSDTLITPFGYKGNGSLLNKPYTKRGACLTLLKFAIVIDNPDDTDPNNLKIIGPMSPTIIIQKAYETESAPRELSEYSSNISNYTDLIKRMEVNVGGTIISKKCLNYWKASIENNNPHWRRSILRKHFHMYKKKKDANFYI